MTTTGYDDRVLLIEVTGLRRSDLPSSHYTFKIPYRSLTRTLRFINQNGGKIVRVSAVSLSLPTEKPLQSPTRLETVETAERQQTDPTPTETHPSTDTETIADVPVSTPVESTSVSSDRLDESGSAQQVAKVPASKPVENDSVSNDRLEESKSAQQEGESTQPPNPSSGTQDLPEKPEDFEVAQPSTSPNLVQRLLETLLKRNPN